MLGVEVGEREQLFLSGRMGGNLIKVERDAGGDFEGRQAFEDAEEPPSERTTPKNY